jgi:hypothetical protein
MSDNIDQSTISDIYQDSFLSTLPNNFFNFFNLRNLIKIFGEEYLLVILNNNDLMHALMSMDQSDLNLLIDKSYCLIYFSKLNYTICLNLHSAEGIFYIAKLIAIESGDEESSFNSNSIFRVGDNRYVIILSDFLYDDIPIRTIKILFKYLQLGDFYHMVCQSTIIKNQIIEFIDRLGGINQKLFLNCDNYF